MKSLSIIAAVTGVTKKWAKQRKAEERHESARLNRRLAMLRDYRVTIRDAAWQVMEEAYLKASANDTLPALARQIMYAARPSILKLTGNPTLDDAYFTQTLLPDYIREEGVDWNVFYDARGHFYEPHTDREVPLGTLDVREYLQGVEDHAAEDLDLGFDNFRFPTFGPQHRYSAILFIEKEGFKPILDAVNLCARYDIALASTKGMSVTASRELFEQLGVPLLILHDFDKSGFSIAGTLQRDTRRHTFERGGIEVHDLGLRIGDIAGLESEPVTHGKASLGAVRANLRENGAKEDEVEFLLTKRVELNALASDELVAFIERKLDALKIRKLAPDKATLDEAVLRVRTMTLANEKIKDLLAEAAEQAQALKPVAQLECKVRALLKDNPALPWDAVVAQIVKNGGS